MGVGGKLVAHAERSARTLGYKELASSTEISNELSECAHVALGFREIEWSISFLKKL